MSGMAPRRARATWSDYEAFIAPLPENERWELVDGAIAAMTNPGEKHGLIVRNIFAPMKLTLDKGGCRAFSGSMRVHPSDDRNEDMAATPDILVRCGPRRDRNFATDPTVVIEVLTRSTMVRDRGLKFDFYRSLPTLQHIALVYQDQMRVEHYRRSAEGWLLIVLTRPSDRLSFDAVDVSVDLDTIYLDVAVLRPVETPGMGDDEPATLID